MRHFNVAIFMHANLISCWLLFVEKDLNFARTIIFGSSKVKFSYIKTNLKSLCYINSVILAGVSLTYYKCRQS